MATIQQVLEALEKIAPQKIAYSEDKVGLQIGDPNASVSKAVISLDHSQAALQYAIQEKTQLLLTHHPFFYGQGLDRLRYDHYESQIVMELIRNNIAHIAAHTNWDCARNGLNDKLAEIMELEDIAPFGSGNPQEKVLVTVNLPKEPKEYLQNMLDAITKVGAGIQGNYDRCACYFQGTDTFQPLEGANPLIGKIGKVEEVEVVQLHMEFERSLLPKVYEAVLAHHPYDEPSYEFICLEPLPSHRVGRVGRLKRPIQFSELLLHVEEKLDTKALAWGNPDKIIKKLAVVGGSGGSEWKDAQASGADALLTGEVKHHIAVEASDRGLGVIAAGHYATEQPGCAFLLDRLKESLPEIEWKLFTPIPGTGGRPLSREYARTN
jgi:dinuclear metal center YbgI/SA1388 family protein